MLRRLLCQVLHNRENHLQATCLSLFASRSCPTKHGCFSCPARHGKLPRIDQALFKSFHEMLGNSNKDSLKLLRNSFLLLEARMLLLAMPGAPFVASDRSVRSKARSPVRSFLFLSDALSVGRFLDSELAVRPSFKSPVRARRGSAVRKRRAVHIDRSSAALQLSLDGNVTETGRRNEDRRSHRIWDRSRSERPLLRVGSLRV